MRYIAIVPLILLALTAGAQTTVTETPELNQQQKRGASPGASRQDGSLYIIEGHNCRSHSVKPLIQKEEIAPLPNFGTPGNFTLNRAEIRTIPTTDLRDMLTLSPAVYQSQRGADISVRGGQAGDVLYIIDGMQIARN